MNRYAFGGGKPVSMVELDWHWAAEGAIYADGDPERWLPDYKDPGPYQTQGCHINNNTWVNGQPQYSEEEIRAQEELAQEVLMFEMTAVLGTIELRALFKAATPVLAAEAQGAQKIWTGKNWLMLLRNSSLIK